MTTPTSMAAISSPRLSSSRGAPKVDTASVSVDASDLKKKKLGSAKKKVVETVRCVCSSTVDSGHMVAS